MEVRETHLNKGQCACIWPASVVHVIFNNEMMVDLMPV